MFLSLKQKNKSFLCRILNDRSGVYLLEALLSVVILSVSLTIVIQSMTSSMRAMVVSADYTLALNQLENNLVSFLRQHGIEESIDSAVKEGSQNRFKLKGKDEEFESDVDIDLREWEFVIAWEAGSKTRKLSTHLLHLPIEYE